jgi:uncharacterized protein with von Willebrand factor type A (vWA) domain
MSGAVGMLARNVVHFARLLRRTGLPVGPAETLAAVTSLGCIDIGEHAAFHAALRAVMVHRHEHQDLFDQAFALFWRQPAPAGTGDAGFPAAQKIPPGSRRLAEALAQNHGQKNADDSAPHDDAALTFSASEKLGTMDFEAMSAAEIGRAKSEIKKLRLPLDARRTRRWRTGSSSGHADLRATIRRSLRSGGEITGIVRRQKMTKPPPLVVLCDISGSMTRYAEILLHFLHSVTNDRDRVSVFLFGTRLSNVTRQLKHRDPELSFAMISKLIPDWSGGTRIGEALGAFNRLWARRVLGQGAVVVLVTDGLDRDGAQGLAENMARLQKSCRRLIWLNPLLRWDGFSPKTQGAKAMLPFVDEFRPVHSLASLRGLIASLSSPAPPRGDALNQWKDAL